jgi:hypothetical protein
MSAPKSDIGVRRRHDRYGSKAAVAAGLPDVSLPPRQRRNSRHPSTAAWRQHATWHVAEAANRSERTQTFVAERAAFIGALRILLEDGV